MMGLFCEAFSRASRSGFSFDHFTPAQQPVERIVRRTVHDLHPQRRPTSSVHAHHHLRIAEDGRRLDQADRRLLVPTRLSLSFYIMSERNLDETPAIVSSVPAIGSRLRALYRQQRRSK
jgi:hypothetical protein